MIEHLQKLAPEIVERFLETREAKPLGIPQPLADYILQINEAANLHRRYHSISDCARHLQKSYPELSIHTCKSRIYDSINYLNADSNVTAEAWHTYFSDMFMKLFEVNLVGHNFREAKNCLKLSHEYRVKASANAIDPERLKFKHQIVSADMQLDRMGVKSNGLLAAYKQGLTIIESLDANDTEKKRMIEEIRAELNIEESEYEEIRG